MKYKEYKGSWKDEDIFKFVLTSRGTIRNRKSIDTAVSKNKELEDYLLGRFQDIDDDTYYYEIVYRILNHIEHIHHCPHCGKRILLKTTKNDSHLRYAVFCDECVPYVKTFDMLKLGLFINRENPQPIIKDGIDDRLILDYVISSYSDKTNSVVLKQFERHFEYIKEVQPYIYDYIINRFDDETENRMAIYIYRILNDINKVPKCPSCGKPIHHNSRPGYNRLSYPAFCSHSCYKQNAYKKEQPSAIGIEPEIYDVSIEEAKVIARKYNSVIGLSKSEPNVLKCLYENNCIDEMFPYNKKYRQTTFNDIISSLKKYTYECDFLNTEPINVITYYHFVNRATRGRLYEDIFGEAERSIENYIITEGKPRSYSEVSIIDKNGYFIKKEPLTYYAEMRTDYYVRFGKDNESIDIDVNYMIKYMANRDICKHFMHDSATGKYYTDARVTTQLTTRSQIYYANDTLYVVAADAIKSISEQNTQFSFYTEIIQKMMKPYPFENNCENFDVDEFKVEIEKQKWRNRYSEFFIEGSSNVINYDNKEQLKNAQEWIESGKCPYMHPECSMQPNSIKFWTFRGWPEDYALEKVKENARDGFYAWHKVKETDPQRYYESQITRPEYYMKRLGCSYEEAMKYVSETQKKRTYTLENCINKFGEEEGIKRFNDRQERWQNTLKSRDDYDEIVARKSTGLYSPISQELFDKIIERMEEIYPGFADETHVYYATRNKEFYISIPKSSGVLYDFVITKLKYNLEFNGEHVHPTPEIDASTSLQEKWSTPYGDTYETCHNKDILKKQLIENRGYTQDIIWYKEYCQDKNACVERIVSKLITLYKSFKDNLDTN